MKASLPFKYITAVKNGKHYVVFDFKDANGKRKRKWVGTDLPEKCTKKTLNAKVEEIVAAFANNFTNGINAKNVPSASMDGDDQELGVFFSRWLMTIKPNVARTTHGAYTRISKRFLTYMDEKYLHITLGEVNCYHVQEFLNARADNGAKGSSVRQYYLAIHSAFAYAVKMEMIPIHPMDKLTVPRADRHEVSFYNESELNELFKVFEGDVLELVVHIAAYYGLRRCEVLGLRWDAIDFVNKTITIQRKVVESNEDGCRKLYVESRLKTNSTRRTLPLIPHIEQMLLERKKIDERNRKLCGKSYNTEFDGFVCRKYDGRLIAPNDVTGHFHRVIVKHGMRHLRFHDLRHSCASLLLANDVPMKAIQEWLGHSNYNITANLYSHLEYNAKINSAETIARVLGGEQSKTAKENSDSPT